MSGFFLYKKSIIRLPERIARVFSCQVKTFLSTHYIVRKILYLLFNSNYPLKLGWLVVDIYRNSCFSINQTDGLCVCRSSFFVHLADTFLCEVAKRAAILKISSGDVYPRIYRVWWTNQSARKMLSTCLVNTNQSYKPRVLIICYEVRMKPLRKACQTLSINLLTWEVSFPSHCIKQVK